MLPIQRELYTFRCMDAMRFNLGLNFVLREEIGPYTSTGGYVSASRAKKIADSGGETFAGIARAKNGDWPGWEIVDQRKEEKTFPLNMDLASPTNRDLLSSVESIYLRRYWNGFLCDELPHGLDIAMFDAAVQHQRRTAIRLIQKSVDASADGIMGPKTIHLARQAPLDKSLEKYIGARACLYCDIIARNPSQEKFRQTWFRRLARLLIYILGGVGYGRND